MEQYRRLALQMNLFYHDVSQQEELKPSVLEQGQVRQPSQRVGGAGPDLLVFLSRCVWCTGLSSAPGVGPPWSRSSWTLCAARPPACWWTMENVCSSPLTSKVPASPAGDGLRPVSVSSVLRCVLLAELSFCLLPEDPGGQAGVPPAAVLGQEVPPGWNQTHNPESQPGGGQRQADVRGA